MIEHICGTINWAHGVVSFCDKEMKDQSVSPQNEPSVGPDAELLCGQHDSPQVYLPAWGGLIVL